MSNTTSEPQEQEDNSLETLAKQLAINHWNSSLSTRNLDYPTKNTKEQKEKESESFNIIFESDKLNFEKKHDDDFHPLGFTRNILIIGAGASKNAFDSVPIANELIKNMYNELGIYKAFGEDVIDNLELKFFKSELKDLLSHLKKTEIKRHHYHLLKKFIFESFQYLGEMEDYTVSLEDLKKKLGFEGGIVVIQNFIEKNTLNKYLSDLLHHKYIPNIFYEITSHLFKHRFIDVIINLNFDELLDNAIEDELGSGEYIKIYNDASCPEFKDSLVDGRLRKPLYIKPHGTISDIDSLKYSKSQYIDITPSLKEVLNSIFLGETSSIEMNSSNIIKQYNISIAGFGMQDLDIISAMIPNLIKNTIIDSEKFKTSIHIFDCKPVETMRNLYDGIPHKFKDNNDLEGKSIISEMKLKLDDYFLKKEQDRNGVFPNKFIEEVIRKHRPLDPEIFKTIIHEFKAFFDKDKNEVEVKIKGLKESKVHFHELNCTKDNTSKNLDDYFLELYSKIQECFQKPFKPNKPVRHLWNSAIFNEKYFEINKEIFEKDKGKTKFLLDRAKVNLLFDFYKFNGLVPNHVIYADRAGKYYKLYLESIKDKNKDIESLKEYIIEAFSNYNCIVNSEEMYLIYEEFYNSCFDPDFNKEKRLEIQEKVRKVICGKLKEINETLDLDYEKENFLNTSYPFKNSIENIPYGASHELSPNYLDNKHFQFSPFKSKHIINTNLCLTWKFYEFATKDEDWDELQIIGNTGKAFFNLDEYQKSENTHLHKLVTREIVKKISIYHLREKPVKLIKGKQQTGEKKYELLKKIYSKCPECRLEESKECKKCKSYEKIKFFSIKEQFATHKIALFLKKEKPVHGIYFFNPPSKSRINPVWFSVTDKENKEYNKYNLNIIKKLFDKTIDSLPKNGSTLL